MAARPPRAYGAQRAQRQQDHPGCDEVHLEPRLHVPQVQVAEEGDSQYRRSAEQEQQRGPVAPHNSHHPTRTLLTRATTHVTEEKRAAKDFPKVPAWRAISFRSTIGPTTMKTSRAVGEKPVREAATKASASLHTQSTTASTASSSTDSHGEPVKRSRMDLGTTMLNVAAAPAPRTRNPPACRKSCWSPARKPSQREPVVFVRAGFGSRIHSSRPKRTHSQPITTAVAREASSRASTIIRLAGKAIEVA